MLRVARFRGWSEDSSPRLPVLPRPGPSPGPGIAAPPQPARQHTAMLARDIEADGWTRLTLNVHNRRGAIVRSQSNLLHAFYPDANDWPSVRNGLPWSSNRTVEAPTLLFTMQLNLAATTLNLPNQNRRSITNREHGDRNPPPRRSKPPSISISRNWEVSHPPSTHLNPVDPHPPSSNSPSGLPDRNTSMSSTICSRLQAPTSNGDSGGPQWKAMDPSWSTSNPTPRRPRGSQDCP